MAEKLRRISVAVDERTNDLLKTLARRKNKTVSEIIRSAIGMYSEIENGAGISPEKTVEYLELLSSKDHVIVDIELWTAILDELTQKGSEEFWELVEKIGYEHGIQYKAMGMTRIDDILSHLEKENWFKVNTNNGSYTLVLFTRSEQRILKVFLQSMFKAIGLPVEIIEGFRKLIIVKKNCSTDALC
ncbi:ribbon-helix-helix protein, CopG family [Archaeoglobus veneficus]|uniref:CopG-like domain-containing protein DNA-binding protein n=1 Tax=Archaeoglobus veneficus (strain DSM 11195 / SNP6) TaxID=693661 RepID=F2KN75_ARCVS|nr:ribbon-helix-helix protein, CopG family [Archaeoglobus veneficus]AEA46176.1 CopG-like domain-containing protein DNA-binding protein [Archaeoglobus veneficus SNP6]